MRKRLTRGDDGIAMVFTAAVMVVLLACASLAIDVGQTSANVRAVQNSADAAAVAAANDCALGLAIRDLTQFNNGAGATCDMTNGLAIGTASKSFTRLFGTSSLSVNRTATAQWSTIKSAATLTPITIASCEFNLSGGSQVWNLDDPNPHTGCSSLPGGFSMLQYTTDAQGHCIVDTTSGTGLDGKPGETPNKKEGCVSWMIGKPVLVPIYDSNAISKVNHDNGQGPYPILGYAEISFEGYRFNNKTGGTAPTCASPDGKIKDCIQGTFIRFVTTLGTPGGSTPFGVYRVSLIK
jgi:Flp pilus assembly protein TadG